MFLLETLYAFCPANSLTSIFKCKKILISNSNGCTGDYWRSKTQKERFLIHNIHGVFLLFQSHIHRLLQRDGTDIQKTFMKFQPDLFKPSTRETQNSSRILSTFYAQEKKKS
jgi:hypothetical protein